MRAKRGVGVAPIGVKKGSLFAESGQNVREVVESIIAIITILVIFFK